MSYLDVYIGYVLLIEAIIWVLSILGIYLFGVYCTFKMVKVCQNNPDNAIRFGNRCLPFITSIGRKNAIHLGIAVAWFTKYEDEQFIEEINKVNHKAIVYNKLYWLAIYYLINNDILNAERVYSSFCLAWHGSGYQKCLKILIFLFNYDGKDQDVTNFYYPRQAIQG